MKKSIIIIALTAISTLSFAQVKQKPVKAIAPKAVASAAAPADTFKFTLQEATLLYQLLEDDKKFYSMSDDISGRKANTIYIPRADSLIRVLTRQAKAFEDAKAMRENLKADTVKKVNKSQKREK